jgi:glutathione S-transferase
VITLYGFGRIFPEGHGDTKDMWVQWALEELGLPYRVHALDHTGGELDGEAYARISPFHQVPLIEDGGFVVAESAAIVLYLAEKAGRLMPPDHQGRTRVTQWCFAAVATLAPTFVSMDLAGIYDPDKAARQLHEELPKLAHRWLSHVEQRLASRTWIACDDFTAADLLLACVLRYIRKTDLLQPYPAVKAFYERCMARPAWQRTLRMYAERLGTTVDAVR